MYQLVGDVEKYDMATSLTFPTDLNGSILLSIFKLEDRNILTGNHLKRGCRGKIGRKANTLSCVNIWYSVASGTFRKL